MSMYLRIPMYLRGTGRAGSLVAKSKWLGNHLWATAVKRGTNRGVDGSNQKKSMVKIADLAFVLDICLYPPRDAASQLCIGYLRFLLIRWSEAAAMCMGAVHHGPNRRA